MCEIKVNTQIVLLLFTYMNTSPQVSINTGTSNQQLQNRLSVRTLCMVMSWLTVMPHRCEYVHK